MVIKGYFDDSGDDKKKRFAAVGGLIGAEGAWSDFEMKWAPATYHLKRPFHSTDCEAQQGCCKGWTIDQTRSLMKRLTNIIKESRLGLFGAVVSIPEYRATSGLA